MTIHIPIGSSVPLPDFRYNSLICYCIKILKNKLAKEGPDFARQIFIEFKLCTNKYKLTLDKYLH